MPSGAARKKHWGGGNNLTFNDVILFVQMKICCHFYDKFLLLNARIVHFKSLVTLTISVTTQEFGGRIPSRQMPMGVGSKGRAPALREFHNIFFINNS